MGVAPLPHWHPPLAHCTHAVRCSAALRWAHHVGHPTVVSIVLTLAVVGQGVGGPTIISRLDFGCQPRWGAGRCCSNGGHLQRSRGSHGDRLRPPPLPLHRMPYAAFHQCGNLTSCTRRRRQMHPRCHRPPATCPTNTNNTCFPGWWGVGVGCTALPKQQRPPPRPAALHLVLQIALAGSNLRSAHRRARGRLGHWHVRPGQKRHDGAGLGPHLGLHTGR